MLSTLIIYGIFCLTTAITSLLLLFIPTIRELQYLEPLNPVAENKFISYFTFFCLALLTAPILLLPVLFPSQATSFKNTLLETFQS